MVRLSESLSINPKITGANGLDVGQISRIVASCCVLILPENGMPSLTVTKGGKS